MNDKVLVNVENIAVFECPYGGILTGFAVAAQNIWGDSATSKNLHVGYFEDGIKGAIKNVGTDILEVIFSDVGY